MEGNGRNELKRGENRQIWQNSMQQAKIGQTGWLGQWVGATVLANGAAAPAIRKLSEIYFFRLYRDWATWHIMFWPSWLYYDIQNSSKRHSLILIHPRRLIRSGEHKERTNLAVKTCIFCNFLFHSSFFSFLLLLDFLCVFNVRLGLQLIGG